MDGRKIQEEGDSVCKLTYCPQAVMEPEVFGPCIWYGLLRAKTYPIGNTVDFMDAEKRRIFSRFSPEAPYIRGIDICDDIIGMASSFDSSHHHFACT